jgi:hypothetical protein
VADTTAAHAASSLAFRSSQEAFAHPQAEGLPGPLGSGETQGVLGVGEAGSDHLLPGVLGLRATGAGVHAPTIASTGSLDEEDFSEYGKYMTQTVTTTKARLLLNGDTILVTNKWWNTENGPLIPATKATARKWVREATVVSVEKMAHVYWVETSEGGFNASPQQTFQVVGGAS